jgi:pimeloyl-ACP methyl ester carboxylesterase
VLYRREETLACWRSARTPAVMVLGEHSEIRQREGGGSAEARLRADFPRFEIETLRGVGHMMHHEDPAAVARLIEAFAARHERQ